MSSRSHLALSRRSWINLLSGLLLLVVLVGVFFAHAPSSAAESTPTVTFSHNDFSPGVIESFAQSLSYPNGRFVVKNDSDLWFGVHITATPSGQDTQPLAVGSDALAPLFWKVGMLPPHSLITLNTKFSHVSQQVQITYDPLDQRASAIYTGQLILSLVLSSDLLNSETITAAAVKALFELAGQLPHLAGMINDVIQAIEDPGSFNQHMQDALNELQEVISDPNALGKLTAVLVQFFSNQGVLQETLKDALISFGEKLAAPVALALAIKAAYDFLNTLIMAFAVSDSGGGSPSITLSSGPAGPPAPTPTPVPGLTQCIGTSNVSYDPAGTFEVIVDLGGVHTIHNISPQIGFNFISGAQYSFSTTNQTFTFTPGSQVGLLGLPPGQAFPSQYTGGVSVASGGGTTILIFSFSQVIYHVGAVGYPSFTQVGIAGHLNLATHTATIVFGIETILNPFSQDLIQVTMSQTCI